MHTNTTGGSSGAGYCRKAFSIGRAGTCVNVNALVAEKPAWEDGGVEKKIYPPGFSGPLSRKRRPRPSRQSDRKKLVRGDVGRRHRMLPMAGDEGVVLHDYRCMCLLYRPPPHHARGFCLLEVSGLPHWLRRPDMAVRYFYLVCRVVWTLSAQCRGLLWQPFVRAQALVCSRAGCAAAGVLVAAHFSILMRSVVAVTDLCPWR